MKKIILASVLFLFCAEISHAQIEFLSTFRYMPKVIHTRDSEKYIPAGYEVGIPWIYHGVCAISWKDDFWTFLSGGQRYGAIAIPAPMHPYDGETKTLRITDSTRTTYRSISYDSLGRYIPEDVLCKDLWKNVTPFSKKKRNRENMMITNDSLTIYLINIPPKHLEAVRKIVTTPIDDD